MSVFSGMADIFAETFGVDDGTATYSPPDRSVAIPCRPIGPVDADPDGAEFAGKPRVAGRVISVLASEVASPVAGGLFTIAGESYSVVGKPALELPERIMWRCETA
jgi:hypothetical protein